jgi:hypothetical protein
MSNEIRYARFGREDEFLEEILHRIATTEVYPKVSAIAGKRIRPDIDLLEIRKESQTQYKLIGYELKLIKFDNRSKGLSWNAFYQGIGQALLSLKHGIHRCVLLIGFHKNIPDDKFLDEFHEMLWKGRENLYSQILGSYISIGIYLYKGGNINFEIEAKSDFYPPNESINLSRQNLLSKNFTYDKRLKNK